MRTFYLILILTGLIGLVSCHTVNQDEIEYYQDNREPENDILASMPEYKSASIKYRQVKLLFDSLNYYKSVNNTAEIIRMKIKLADYLRQTGNYQQGINFLNEALQFRQSLLSDVNRGKIFNGKAAIFYEMYIHHRHPSYLDSSWHYSEKTLQIADSVNQFQLKADALTHKGAILVQNEQFTEAEQLLREAYQISTEYLTGPPLAIMANLAWANFKKSNFEDALSWIEVCYNESLRANNEGFVAISLDMMKKIHRALGNDEAVQEISEQLKEVSAQNNVLFQHMMMKELLTNYEKIEYKKEILGLYQEQYFLVRLTFVLIAISILLVAALLIVFKFLQQHKNLREKERELSLLRQQEDALKIKNTALELSAKAADQRALETKLEAQDQKLAAKLMTLSQMNEFLNHLRKMLASKEKSMQKSDAKIHCNELVVEINKHLNNNIWEEFEILYASGNSNFINKLNELHPGLTTNEKRLSYLIVTGLRSKEIASVMSKNYRAVEMARHRLRTRLGLEKNQPLEGYLKSLID